MPRARRRKPYDPAMAHDRRSRDLLRNAEVATVEVDNPLALEPARRSLPCVRSATIRLADCIRIARSTRRSIRPGGRSRATGKRPSADRARSTRPGNMSTAGRAANRLPRASARRCCG
jgi:hypothetical protein